MATFSRLEPTKNYTIIDGETGYSRTDSIQGADAMATDWDEGDEAWPSGEQDFAGKPIDVAE